jgi:arylsulfatase A
VAKNENQAHYFANVANMDAAVGKLMAGLKALSIDDNTLVVFTSDNGPETLLRYDRAKRSYGVATPLRGMKLWTTDAGFRVAGIMRWPAKIEAGSVAEQTVSSLDFLPTFCELAGTAPPPNLLLDGTSFLPALASEQIDRKKPLVWVYYNALNERRVAMRDGDWKVLARLNLPKYASVNRTNQAAVQAAELDDFQIFNVTNDSSESKDLSESHPDKLAELQQRLEDHYRELVVGSHIWDIRK